MAEGAAPLSPPSHEDSPATGGSLPSQKAMLAFALALGWLIFIPSTRISLLEYGVKNG